VWSGFTWLRMGTVGGLWWMQWWTFWFWRHGVSSVIETQTWVLNVRRCQQRVDTNSVQSKVLPCRTM
jgi:hypothetical protein